MRFLAILRRRWLVVAVITVLALAGAAIAITALQPRWRASATVVLHLGGPQVLDKVKNVTEDSESRLLAYKEYYQTQREIIGSRTVAERALATSGSRRTRCSSASPTSAPRPSAWPRPPRSTRSSACAAWCSSRRSGARGC
nr:Wzz/FepE/Etk N-terminal domain-containing protein [Nannocystis pusilla]